jgi:predicted RNA-binding Zn-ribbon protein involved in translation (DUF1610 family)
VSPMPHRTQSDPMQVPATAAVCGLCCDVCSILIASHEDPQRLALLAGRMGWKVDEAYCDGCRSDRLTPYCRDCDLRACAQQRGHTFCSECADYPCPELEGFQREKPHRAELYQNLERIAEVGAESWLSETRARYSCPMCGTLNSTYDLKCRNCGHEPSCAFVDAHKDLIVAALRGL